MKIVIIGGVAAGPKAAARARRLLPEAEITMVDQGDKPSYAACGFPFYIAGWVPELQDLLKTSDGILRSVEYFWTTKRIRALIHTRAEEIDRQNRRVRVRHLENGHEDWLPYDRLVLATGATPARPPIPGMDLEGVFFLHNPADAAAIRGYLTSGEVKQAVIVGAGVIGLEMADALANRKVRVTVLELADQILPGPLDPEMAHLAQSQAVDPLLRIVTGAPVQGLEGDERVSAVVTSEGTFEADLVLVATGVKPNVELAKAAGLELGQTGALTTDEFLHTSDPLIFAGGDCIENVHLVTGKRVYIPLGSTANKHGWVIGSNLAGFQERFPGVLGTMALQTFDCNIARTGLTEREAREAGYDVVTALRPGFDCAHYHPMHDRVILKLVADANTGRLLGAQGIGAGEVVRRIDVLATAISFNATLDMVAKLDLAYAPPFAEPMDAAIQAAALTENKRQNLARTIRAEELLPAHRWWLSH